MRHPAGPLLLLLLVAIASRAQVFGNPLVSIDEQFYRLIGHRMLAGALPYVDIWDRKPIGLFLLFAGFAGAGAWSVIASQLVALAATVATAWLVFVMARRITTRGAALAAASIYILFLTVAGGESVQSPVLYNLPMVAAFALLFFASEAEGGPSLRTRGMAAMLLVGVALTIKSSVVFEGLFFGLAWLWMARRDGRRRGSLLGDALLWIGCAVAPTAAAMLVYAALGHFPDWLFANVTSILARRPELPATAAHRLVTLAAIVAPLLLCFVLRWATRAGPGADPERARLRLVDAWSAAALLGVILFGIWYIHYALPLFAPLALSAAALGNSRPGRAYLALLVVGAAIVGQLTMARHIKSRGDGAVLSAAAAATRGHRGCIFVYDGPTALYDAANSCLPTTRPFPAHLQDLNEGGATGIDQRGEVSRIMAARPDRVMTMEPAYADENPAVRQIVATALARDYVPLYRYAGGKQQLVVYELRGAQRE